MNGNLFGADDIEIPPFSEEIQDLLLRKASEEFDWSGINGTIFGAVFESTLNPETRRSGGMHYTSIENIHKLIDPLFLDELKEEFRQIRQMDVWKQQKPRLEAFQDKLARLRFLDPAAGSGNFLTETFTSLRRLENEVIALLTRGQMSFGEAKNPVKVSIGQFAGIEINDFAVTVARTALWIAENQMLRETEDIVRMNIDFLPLKTTARIVEGNALRMDWGEVAKKEELNYIIGNPPFVGYSLQSKEQKADILSIFVDEKGKPYKTAGKIDYVSGWFWKASELMKETDIRTAFVSTNSITQGEQVASIWQPLFERFGIHIDYAYRTFRWDSEASIKAHVHCVILGFSCGQNPKKRLLFVDSSVEEADTINPYLVAAETVFIESRKKPLSPVPQMLSGNRPTDGGYLILSAEEKEALLRKEPAATKWVKQFMMGYEFINRVPRYCLWLVGITPNELRKLPLVMERVAQCKNAREESPDPGRRKLAETPTLFREQLNPETAIVVPKVSSERRRYVPIGYLGKDVIAGDKLFIIPDAKLFHFGILTSNIHMAWMRAVCGRLKSDYSYSINVVYNNFVWPEATEEQKAEIEKTAQAILDARAIYPDSSLADLYAPLTMPSELRKAHQANDKAVMKAYGMPIKETDEAGCVGWLMRLYKENVSRK